jgi:hypothetical protein
VGSGGVEGTGAATGTAGATDSGGVAGGAATAVTDSGTDGSSSDGGSTDGGSTDGSSSDGGSTGTGGVGTSGGVDTGSVNGTGGTGGGPDDGLPPIPTDCVPVSAGPASPTVVQSEGWPGSYFDYLDFQSSVVTCALPSECREACLAFGAGERLCAASLCDFSTSYCDFPAIWTNASSAKAPGAKDPFNDAAKIVLSSGSYPERLLATSFDFQIPSEALVTGILAEVSRAGDEGGSISGYGTRDSETMLIRAGQPTGENKADPSQLWSRWTASPPYKAYGGPTSRWGVAWTAADINSADFGLAFSGEYQGTAGVEFSYVDHIRLTVSYCEP